MASAPGTIILTLLSVVGCVGVDLLVATGGRLGAGKEAKFDDTVLGVLS